MMSGELSINGTLILPPRRDAILTAARLIRRGGLVAFPTETVYGLGADALQGRAVARIFAAKGRPVGRPLIVHVADLEQVEQVVSAIPDSARELIRRFWPGPLSLVLPRSAALPGEVSAGLPTVAVRMPAHPVALRLIRSAGVPIAAPSANRFGRPSPTRLRHVLQELAGKIDAVIDGGPCPVGVESTVLDLSGARPAILRPGGISREQLEGALGIEIGEESTGDSPRLPGLHRPRYALRTPLILLIGSRKRCRAALRSLSTGLRRRGLKIELLLIPPGPDSAAKAARDLFPELRRLDARGADLILAEGISPGGMGRTVMNRLRRAAGRVIRV